MCRESSGGRTGTFSSSLTVREGSVAQRSVNVAVGDTHCEASLSRCCIFAVHKLDCAVDALTNVAVDTRLASEMVRAEIASSITNPRRLSRRCWAGSSYPSSGIVMESACSNKSDYTTPANLASMPLTTPPASSTGNVFIAA